MLNSLVMHFSNAFVMHKILNSPELTNFGQWSSGKDNPRFLQYLPLPFYELLFANIRWKRQSEEIRIMVWISMWHGKYLHETHLRVHVRAMVRRLPLGPVGLLQFFSSIQIKAYLSICALLYIKSSACKNIHIDISDTST